jgi:hypothetical protein
VIGHSLTSLRSKPEQSRQCALMAFKGVNGLFFVMSLYYIKIDFNSRNFVALFCPTAGFLVVGNIIRSILARRAIKWQRTQKKGNCGRFGATYYILWFVKIVAK